MGETEETKAVIAGRSSISIRYGITWHETRNELLFPTTIFQSRVLSLCLMYIQSLFYAKKLSRR